MVPGKRHGCLLFAVIEMAISHRPPQEPGVSLRGCNGACCTQLWKKFCVKVLKNILWLIGIYVFLSHVGKDTSGWFYLELNWIAELLFWFFAHELLPWLSCFSVFLCWACGAPGLQGIWAWFCKSSMWGTASNFSEISGHGTVTLSVLKKTYHDQGLCLLALIVPALAFI